jgi:hypothetical protein
MPTIQETTRTLPFHRPVPLTGLLLLYQREHLFLYTSYGDTKAAPMPRAFRMVVLGGSVTACPHAAAFVLSMGGRISGSADTH